MLKATASLCRDLFYARCKGRSVRFGTLLGLLLPARSEAPRARFPCLPGCRGTALGLSVAFYGIGSERRHSREQIVNNSEENTSCPAGNSAYFNPCFRSCPGSGGMLQSTSSAVPNHTESFCVFISPHRAKMYASTFQAHNYI